MTPGPYIHIGGDEAQATTPADYATFMDRVQQIVAPHGKRVHGLARDRDGRPLADGRRPVLGHHDRPTPTVGRDAAANGTKLVLSPANHAYLDMKYTEDTPLGQDWAGLIEVAGRVRLGSGAYVTGVGETAVLGVEAPLWTETIRTSADIEYMAFPRLPAIAELGWSPAVDARLDGVPAAAGRAGAALGGDGDQLLPLAAGALGVVAAGRWVASGTVAGMSRRPFAVVLVATLALSACGPRRRTRPSRRSRCRPLFGAPPRHLAFCGAAPLLRRRSPSPPAPR